MLRLNDDRAVLRASSFCAAFSSYVFVSLAPALRRVSNHSLAGVSRCGKEGIGVLGSAFVAVVIE